MADATSTDQEPDVAPVLIQPVKSYFSVAEAATYIGCAATNIRRYIREGYLPAAQFVPKGRILVKRDDLDALWQANLIAPEEVA